MKPKDAILLMDRDGRIRRINETAKQLIGGRSDAAGRRLEDVWPGARALGPLLADALSDRPPASVTLPLFRNGRNVDHAVRMELVHGPDETTDVLVSLSSLEPPLPGLSSNEGSRDLPVLGRLIGHVAHKIKNSLNLFVLHGALLREKVASGIPGSVQHLDAQDAEVLRLNQVIQGLLKFSAPESLERLDLGADPLLRGAAAEFTSRGKNREIGVELDIADGLPAVRGDREMLQQALINVFSHVRSTMPAAAALRVSARQSEDRIVVQVEDASVSATAGSDEAGSLDLFIADRIVRLHGGELRSGPSSSPRPCYTLTLPLA